MGSKVREPDAGCSSGTDCIELGADAFADGEGVGAMAETVANAAPAFLGTTLCRLCLCFCTSIRGDIVGSVLVAAINFAQLLLMGVSTVLLSMFVSVSVDEL